MRHSPCSWGLHPQAPPPNSIILSVRIGACERGRGPQTLRPKPAQCSGILCSQCVAMGVCVLPGVSESRGHLTRRRCERASGSSFHATPHIYFISVDPQETGSWAASKFRSEVDPFAPSPPWVHFIPISTNSRALPTCTSVWEDPTPPCPTLCGGSCGGWSPRLNFTRTWCEG